MVPKQKQKPALSSTELIVALDFSKPDQALTLMEKLDGLPIIYKVGLELFLVGGVAFVEQLVMEKEKRVFLDLKFHDIPNTVSKAAQQAAMMGVEMFTLHLAGGGAMVRAVRELLEQVCDGDSIKRPKILGVTVLTSFDDSHWSEVTRALTGHAAKPADSVEGLVERASDWGVDGVVCSPHELPRVLYKNHKLYTVVPGIRPAGEATHDQARVMTPAQARAAGASAIVVGRPITASADSRAAAVNILKDLGAGKWQ